MWKFDAKFLAAAVASFTLIIGSTSGYLYVSTPAAQQCEVDLRDAQVRLELLTEIQTSCKTALESCITE